MVGPFDHVNFRRLIMPKVVSVLLVVLALATIFTAASPRPVIGTTEGSLQKQFAFRTAMRSLWEEHVVWTRLYIVSVAAGLPDADATAQRLLRNQGQIGDAVKPFYGKAAGDRLTGLLREHILTAAELLAAVKKEDAAKAESAKARWYANADDIGAFLSGANPRHWPLTHMRPMMRAHLDLTLEEAAARLKGDWTADIAAYEKVRRQILEMAEMLSDGIIRQFPDKFR
jgi:hypothetical protein